jgi:hypothetical protein
MRTMDQKVTWKEKNEGYWLSLKQELKSPTRF